ncbi:MAG: ABC transporter permease [Chloroflexi bacterium]|nr:ABC transporter permease [Chloroflexota bacterium]
MSRHDLRSRMLRAVHGFLVFALLVVGRPAAVAAGGTNTAKPAPLASPLPDQASAANPPQGLSSEAWHRIVQQVRLGEYEFVPLGIVSALRQNTLWDYLGMSVAVFGVSVPAIILGPLLIVVFALTLRWLPVAGWGTPAHMLMPALALGLSQSAIIARLTRASMLQVIREDYIRTARAKGLIERAVMVRHALKNAFIPVATILGPMFAAVVTGTFVVEQIFAVPGLGRYFVVSITQRDYPVVMGTILLYALILMIANLTVDVTYAFLDPRIRCS